MVSFLIGKTFTWFRIQKVKVVIQWDLLPSLSPWRKRMLLLFRVSFQLFYAYMSIYSLLLHSFYRNSITSQTPNFAVMATLYSLNSKMRRHHFHIHHCKLTTWLNSKVSKGKTWFGLLEGGKKRQLVEQTSHLESNNWI